MDTGINFSKPRFDTNEAAQYLGNCSPYTLRRSRTTGLLFGLPAPTFKKRGRTVVYEREVLDAFNSQFAELSNTSAHVA